MSVFVTITANLNQNKEDYFETSSEETYVLSGVASPSSKLLYVDEEIVQISPFTNTWSKTMKAPKTGAKTRVSHIVRVFGSEANPHQLSSASNIINILVYPPC